MASTYVNALRLNEMGTGDESGNWGVVTNLNLDMIGEAFGYGSEAIANASTHTITMADGAVDEARNFYLKCTGGGQACTVTLAPNTVSKIWIIENATSYTLTFSQGSGANVAIPAGDVKVIATDGAGGGAVVYDLFVDLNIATKLTIKNPATSASPATVLLQAGDTDVAVNDVLGKIQFQAPDEGAGTDAILVAAEVAAISEGDFSSSNNATKLAFKTGASEAATEKMSISSTGNVTMKQTATGDDTPMTLLLQTGETDIAVNDILGKIQFQAPDEGAGTDAILVAAEIAATSEGDFSSSNNATSLQFKTGASEAAATKLSLTSAGALVSVIGGSAGVPTYAITTGALGVNGIYVATANTLGFATAATERMKIGSAGTCTLTTAGSGFIVPDGGNFGSTTTPTAIDVISTGQVGMGQSGYAAAQLYLYDNSTGANGLRVHLDNASSAYSAVYVSHDGTGAAGYFVTAGANYGLYGQGASYGIYGKTTAAGSGGVLGYTADSAHYGILGHANTHGFYGTSVYCVGALYKGSGTFRIPHGLREGYDLLHSFVEGPQCDLIYRGKVALVDGQATISMDTKYGMTAGTFEWLTKAEDVQTFTSNETGWDAVKSSFSGDTITIECQNASSTDTISWMVVAERGDPNIKASEITDDDGNLIIERPSEPEPEFGPTPTPPPPPPEPEED